MHFSRNFILLKCCLLCLTFPAFSQQYNEALSSATECPISTIQPIEIDGGIQGLPENAVKIISNKTQMKNNEIARFSGGVTLVNKDQKITADELEFNRLSSQINAKGNIHFQNNSMDIFAGKLEASETANSTSLHESSYQLANSPGHGSAEKLSINAEGSLHLYDSTFTTCLGEKPDWELRASEINIYAAENKGEAYHAQFRVMDVPVLYLPYFSFPVEQKRKSGLLYPEFGSSSSTGVEFSQPIYWNIAENYDATITPHYMSKRGLQLLTEFRYLSGDQTGVLDIEYLNEDDELKNSNDARYLARWQHTGSFSDRFRAYVDYTTISDDNYIVDIGTKQYNDNDAYLYQVGELSYFADTWQTTLKLQDFEVLGDHIQSYKTLPQLEFSSYQDLPLWQSRFDVYSEISRFETNDSRLPEATRYHVEAGFTLPFVTPAYFFNSEIKLLQTHYEQENIATNSKLKKSVSRTLPKVRFHGGVNFDREINLFSNSFIQTFEPQLQYLYIPEKDQSEIGVYDTTTLQDDYAGLFRDKRFSGLDRIAQANQYSWGVTSRLLDSSNVEQFRLSVGRIVYINDSNIEIDTIQGGSSDKSALAADLFVRLSNQWQISADIQYNTEASETDTGQANIDYHYDENHVIQLNHRYSRNVSGTSIEQLSLLSSAQINKDWQFVGRITQDLKQKRSLESYAGFQYESCCWAIRFAYHRHINSNLDAIDFAKENRDEFDTGFMVQFILKGLSGQQKTVGIQDMFNSSIFGYKQPYFLNN